MKLYGVLVRSEYDGTMCPHARDSEGDYDRSLAVMRAIAMSKVPGWECYFWEKSEDGKTNYKHYKDGRLV